MQNYDLLPFQDKSMLSHKFQMMAYEPVYDTQPPYQPTEEEATDLAEHEANLQRIAGPARCLGFNPPVEKMGATERAKAMAEAYQLEAEKTEKAVLEAKGYSVEAKASVIAEARIKAKEAERRYIEIAASEIAKAVIKQEAARNEVLEVLGEYVSDRRGFWELYQQG